MKELIALVADKSMSISLQTILSRPQAVGMRPLPPRDYDVTVHPDRDAGVVREGPEFVRTQLTRYRHALLLCDLHGSGREDLGRVQLETELETRLKRCGWHSKRCAAIVIDPELEVWLWINSPHVEKALGWQGRHPGLRDWLLAQRYLAAGSAKPSRPKEALEDALARVQHPRSSAIFQLVGARVSFDRCTDPAFRKLVAVLRKWFPER